MPRDSNGNFTLVAGNPVAPDTDIESNWANTTLDDIKAELTNSLDRGGRGAMTAQLKSIAGTVSAPGWSFALELNSGFYRAGAGDIRFSLSATDVLKFTSAGFTSYSRFRLERALPGLDFYETDAAVDEKLWAWQSEAGNLILRTRDDAGSNGVVAATFVRGTGTAFSGFQLPASGLPTLLFNSPWCGVGSSASTNLGFFVNSSSVAVEQLRLTGSIVRATGTSDPAQPSARYGLYSTDFATERGYFGFPTSLSDLMIIRNIVGNDMAFRVSDNVTKLEITTTGVEIGDLTITNDIELGHATDTTLTRISAGRIAVEGDELAQIRSGTYTGTSTGLTTSPTGTVRWEKVGNVVTLYIPSGMTGTSNSTSYTITGSLPSEAQTVRDVYIALMRGGLANNGSNPANQMGVLLNTATSTLTFLCDGSTTGFTGSGLKGANLGMCISYITT